MTVSLDTNVVIRLFIQDNQRQSEAALTALEKYDSIYISDIALVETVYGLAYHYKLGRKEAVKRIETLLGLPKINCNKLLFRQALPFFVAHPALSIEDCCMATYAELNNATPLLTFDKKLANQLPHTELL
jgi:predicted nucleic-acid-binding protein